MQSADLDHRVEAIYVPVPNNSKLSGPEYVRSVQDALNAVKDGRLLDAMMMFNVLGLPEHATEIFNSGALCFRDHNNFTYDN